MELWWRFVQAMTRTVARNCETPPRWWRIKSPSSTTLGSSVEAVEVSFSFRSFYFFILFLKFLNTQHFLKKKNHLHVKERNTAFIKKAFIYERSVINVSIIFSGNNRIFDRIEVHTRKSVALCISTSESACRDFQPSKITVIVIIIIVPPSSIPVRPHSRVPVLLPPPPPPPQSHYSMSATSPNRAFETTGR